jgi:hypothetical protein
MTTNPAFGVETNPPRHIVPIELTPHYDTYTITSYSKRTPACHGTCVGDVECSFLNSGGYAPRKLTFGSVASACVLSQHSPLV